MPRFCELSPESTPDPASSLPGPLPALWGWASREIKLYPLLCLPAAAGTGAAPLRGMLHCFRREEAPSPEVLRGPRRSFRRTGLRACPRVPEGGGVGGRQRGRERAKLFTEAGVWWLCSPGIAGFHWLAMVSREFF